MIERAISVQQPYSVGFRKLNSTYELRVIILLNNTEGGTLWLKSLGVLLLMRPLMKCEQEYETLMTSQAIKLAASETSTSKMVEISGNGC